MARFNITLIASLILILLLVLCFSLQKKDPDYHHVRTLQSSNMGSLFFPEEKNEVLTNDVSPLPNQNFSYEFSFLRLETTDELNLSDYSCRPISFGLSLAEGSSLFPWFQYPQCSNVTGVTESKLLIDRTLNLLSFDCDPPFIGYYFSGPLPNKSLMKKEATVEFRLNKYKGQVEAENISFAAGVCSIRADLDKKPGHYGLWKRYQIQAKDFQHGDMKPLFNPKLFNERITFVEGKPRIIFLLTLDSISRRHLYRKLPNLVTFMNQSTEELPHIAIYDFQMHSTFGADSAHNQVPIFSGKNATRASSRFKKADALGNTSMWFQLKSKGFLTVMGFDDCDAWFPDVLGENPDVDISIRQFYCLLDVYGQIKSEKNCTEQRCFGPYQTHQYMLRYTLDLVQQYQGLNMWIYLHLNAGHEQTGQHASTLDRDVTKFLRDFFHLTKGRSENFMFLGADHGMRYGDWYKSIEAFQETVLPSMFVIADKSLLDRYQYSYHCLSENTKRLTSKLDIRKTIFALTNISTEVNHGVNWVEEIASYSRDCNDLDSDILFCACSRIKEIKDYNETIRKVVEFVKQKIEANINIMTHRFPAFPVGQFCDEVILDRLQHFYHVSVDSSTEIFKLEFGYSLYEGFRIQASLAVSFSMSNLESYKSEFDTIELFVDNLQHYAKVLII